MLDFVAVSSLKKTAESSSNLQCCVFLSLAYSDNQNRVGKYAIVRLSAVATEGDWATSKDSAKSRTYRKNKVSLI